MGAVDLEVLSKPVSPTDPCGPDLELSGDVAYMNFVAGAEGLLPRSYFGKDTGGNEGRPFDRSQIPFDAQFDAAKPFLEKTRDLRLIGIIAKLCVLNRDFSGFSGCVRAMANLLDTQWDNVHPRAEDGNFGLRAVAIESLDVMPTVVLPLQFLPLLEHSRLGNLSYRAILIARGEVKPTEGEQKVVPAAIDKILSEVELEKLRAVRQLVADLDAAIKKVQGIWREKCASGPNINIDRFAGTVAQILAIFDATVEQRAPSVPEPVAEPAVDGQEADPTKPATAPANARITSTGHAARALAAAAEYFCRHEPSNPSLMIVRQAEALLGKSFLEVLKVLVPDQVAKASVNIGKDHYFPLPIERLAAASSTAAGGAGAISSPTEGPEGLVIDVRTRTEALVLLEQVGNYFRVAEPSSPIPFLIERARDLAQRDFLSVLTTMLPANTLKSS